jgi:hypothetical protein
VADFLSFGEGAHHVRDFGLPEICWLALSTKAVSDFSVLDRLADDGIGEISGTGYERISQATPGWSAPWMGEAVSAEFDPVTWTTHTARDWPEAVRSVVLVSSPDDSGVAICAWNLREGGKPRDLSDSFTTETFHPTVTVAPRKRTEDNHEKAGAT